MSSSPLWGPHDIVSGSPTACSESSLLRHPGPTPGTPWTHPWYSLNQPWSQSSEPPRICSWDTSLLDTSILTNTNGIATQRPWCSTRRSYERLTILAVFWSGQAPMSPGSRCLYPFTPTHTHPTHSHPLTPIPPIHTHSHPSHPFTPIHTHSHPFTPVHIHCTHSHTFTLIPNQSTHSHAPIHTHSHPFSPILTHSHPFSPIHTHSHPFSPILTHSHPLPPIHTHSHPFPPIHTHSTHSHHTVSPSSTEPPCTGTGRGSPEAAHAQIARLLREPGWPHPHPVRRRIGQVPAHRLDRVLLGEGARAPQMIALEWWLHFVSGWVECEWECVCLYLCPCPCNSLTGRKTTSAHWTFKLSCFSANWLKIRRDQKPVKTPQMCPSLAVRFKESLKMFWCWLGALNFALWLRFLSVSKIMMCFLFVRPGGWEKNATKDGWKDKISYVIQVSGCWRKMALVWLLNMVSKENKWIDPSVVLCGFVKQFSSGPAWCPLDHENWCHETFATLSSFFLWTKLIKDKHPLNDSQFCTISLLSLFSVFVPSNEPKKTSRRTGQKENTVGWAWLVSGYSPR